MDMGGIEWASRSAEFIDSILSFAITALAWLSRKMADVQARYPQILSPQTMFGVLGTSIAAWRWWEGRENNLFRRFEEMIARNEARLIKARDELINVMIRPGPGVQIRPPLFIESDLKRVLLRKKWHPRSLFPIGQRGLDERLEKATRTCERKVSAHLARLSFFRQEIASARLIQGALATVRAANARELFESQQFDLEAFDRFREVLALPGHRENTLALELVAQQLTRIEGQDQRAIDTFRELINILQRQDETYSRNLALARAKRALALLSYRVAPSQAQSELSDAVSWLMRLGPPRDRHLLELADLIYLNGLVRLRLGAVIQGPTQLRLAQSYYRNLLRSLRSRRRGLFRWMFETRRFSGHRTEELMRSAGEGLAQTEHLLAMFEKRGSLLVRSLQTGHGVRRHNRKPLPLRGGH